MNLGAPSANLFHIMEIAQRENILGGVLLVAGCCIGAGMLGLPVVSAAAGFLPSSVVFILSWLFMFATGLLLLEVNLHFSKDVSIITMAGRTLGKKGQAACWFLYLYLFYSLMVAYVAGTGNLLSDFASIFGLSISRTAASFVSTALFGLIIYFGTDAVDRFNRLLMLGLVASYALMLSLGISAVKTENLTHASWPLAAAAIPVMVISFGFHNLVPTLTTYYHHSVKRLVLVLFLGSALPLLVYLVWNFLILGITSPGSFVAISKEGDLATEALRNVTGSESVFLVANLFAFFAIVSSFITVALSFKDFLADGFSIPKEGRGKILLTVLVLLPPLLAAEIYPGIFLAALGYAGAYGAVILFGVIPVIMVWKGRYVEKLESKELLPGGKAALLLIAAFALGVTLLQLYQDFGGSL